MTGTFGVRQGGQAPGADFNVFFRHHATYPYYSDAIWYLTQMRRWGQIPEAKPDAWFEQVAKAVYQPGVYRQGRRGPSSPRASSRPPTSPDFASEQGYRGPQDGFIDGLIYDGRHPNAYLQQFAIGLKGDERVQ